MTEKPSKEYVEAHKKQLEASNLADRDRLLVMFLTHCWTTIKSQRQ